MQDKVFIEDLEVETIIGIFGWDRKVKQIVKISLDMDFNISDARQYACFALSFFCDRTTVTQLHDFIHC